MTPKTIDRLAKIGITIQFLALVRTLFEYVRLQHTIGAPFTAAAGAPYVIGGIIAAICTWAGVMLYIYRRPRWTIGAAVGTVVLLIAYKIFFIMAMGVPIRGPR